MNIFLTGITGNLGHEIAIELGKRGDAVIPCIRPGRAGLLSAHPVRFPRVVEADLLGQSIDEAGPIDCIVHAAGVVHFRDAGNANETMMRSVIALGKRLQVPLHVVSTAFVYRPDATMYFNNQYEQDKHNAEQLLVGAQIPHCIYRPAVLTGHSKTGAIRNFTGFYEIVRAFRDAIRRAKASGRILRFPRMSGDSQIVPTDQAARAIVQALHYGRSGIAYVTNPEPPSSAWVFDEVVDWYGVYDAVEVMDLSFEAFGTLDLSPEEAGFYAFSKHFSPYWSLPYEFPPSLCMENLVDHVYLNTALSFFEEHEHHHE